MGPNRETLAHFLPGNLDLGIPPYLLSHVFAATGLRGKDQ